METILDPQNNKYTLFPIEHHDVYKLYKEAVQSFWTVEEVDLADDLRDFARLASDEGGGCVGAQARDEINARAPLAVDALKALARFSDDLFAEKVEEAFPALTALVRCEHAPAEVTRVLGEVFTAKIGPLVIGSLGKS